MELLRHEALPCPARGLELVVYPEATVRSPTVEPGFELNLNTGAAIPFRVDVDADVPDAHWFAIDRSILAERGMAIFGPPAQEVFAPFPRQLLLPLVAESVRWHETASPRPSDAVLNACRALRFALEGTWSSKPDAARWALAQVGERDAIATALAARSSGTEPEPEAAQAVVRFVTERLDELASRR